MGSQQLTWFLLLVLPFLIRSSEVATDEVEQEEDKDVAGSWSSVDVPELSGVVLDQAIRSCRGPYALFLHFGGPDAGDGEEQAFAEFEAAAKMFANVACFAKASCTKSPSVCAEHNARQIPAIAVYPRRIPGAASAQILFGKLEKQDIATAIAKTISDADRALVLSSENMDAFIKDSLKPIKLLLFSSRKTTPLILKALSSDPDLWPHVRFGFVQHTETDLVRKFGVKEVPQLLLGTESPSWSGSSSWETYSAGDMSIDALRDWILAKVRASVVDPGEAGLLRAVEGAGLMSEEVLLEAEDVEEDGTLTETEAVEAATKRPGPKPGSRKPGRARTPAPQPRKKAKPYTYKLLKQGAEGCPPGQEIVTLEECLQAAEELGLKAQPPWVATYPGLPRFCSIRQRPSSKTGAERLHFNSAAEGQGRADLAPICKVAVQPGAKAPVETNEKVPELNAESRDRLLNEEGYCLIYMREGKITDEEKTMLLDLREQFRPQLEHQGTKMRWVWMDLNKERRFKAHFDPPVLPSAVVLNPRKRPRFAMVRHAEDGDGDAMPADQSSIALLLNTVLGGDAEFTNLPAKALTTFMH